MVSSSPSVPLSRWMVFVDGENLTLRAQNLLSDNNVTPIKGSYWRKDGFIWIPGTKANSIFTQGSNRLDLTPIRAYYYTSIVGDDDLLEEVRSKLWSLGFTQRVFKKQKQQEKAKGVDISLTRDMLSHAFNNHYDVAVLMAGDGDYVPLVEEVKHLGKRVLLIFFSETDGLNLALKLAADDYFDLTKGFISNWTDGRFPKA